MTLVFLGWLVLAVMFLLRRRPTAALERRRDLSSLLGIALQGAGFALTWSVDRAGISIVPEMSMSLRRMATVIIGALVVGSIWLTAAAVRTLGKQWSLAARVLESHELITSGPYGIVRNPIYTGMFGLLLATGLAVSTWYALAGGAVLFILGTWVRISAEERLLRGVFGEAYEQYARRVPAFIPRLRVR